MNMKCRRRLPCWQTGKGGQRIVKTLIKNGIVITEDAQDQVWLKGWLMLEEDRIAALGEGNPPEELKADRVVDASGMAVLPGIVDVHTHVCGSLFKGMTEDPVGAFYGLAFPMERLLTPETTYALSMLGAVECLKAGVTCINDIYHYMRSTAKAVDQLGIRGVLAQKIIETDLGTIQYNDYTRIPREGAARVEENCRLIEEYHGKDGRIFCRFGPHATDTVSVELARRIAQLGRQYQVGFHIHVAQKAQEVDFLRETYGMTPVEYLNETGLMGENLVAAHCTCATAEDIRLLEQGGATVAHCAEMYGKRGQFPPVAQMYPSGVRMAYGTDWVTMDPWTNMRTAIMAARMAGCPNHLPDAHMALRLSTIIPARSLGLEERIGSLEAGKQADVILMDLRSPNLTPVFDDPVATIVYNANRHDVDTVWVAGKMLVQEKRLLPVDESWVLSEGQRAASSIYEDYKAGKSGKCWEDEK